MTHLECRGVAYHEAFLADNAGAQAASPYKFNILEVQLFMPISAQDYCFKNELLEAHSVS